MEKTTGKQAEIYLRAEEEMVKKKNEKNVQRFLATLQSRPIRRGARGKIPRY